MEECSGGTAADFAFTGPHFEGTAFLSGRGCSSSSPRVNAAKNRGGCYRAYKTGVTWRSVARDGD